MTRRMKVRGMRWTLMVRWVALNVDGKGRLDIEAYEYSSLGSMHSQRWDHKTV